MVSRLLVGATELLGSTWCINKEDGEILSVLARNIVGSEAIVVSSKLMRLYDPVSGRCVRGSLDGKWVAGIDRPTSGDPLDSPIGFPDSLDALVSCVVEDAAVRARRDYAGGIRRARLYLDYPDGADLYLRVMEALYGRGLGALLSDRNWGDLLYIAVRLRGLKWLGSIISPYKFCVVLAERNLYAEFGGSGTFYGPCETLEATGRFFAELIGSDGEWREVVGGGVKYMAVWRNVFGGFLMDWQKCIVDAMVVNLRDERMGILMGFFKAIGSNWKAQLLESGLAAGREGLVRIILSDPDGLLGLDKFAAERLLACSFYSRNPNSDDDIMRFLELHDKTLLTQYFRNKLDCSCLWGTANLAGRRLKDLIAMTGGLPLVTTAWQPRFLVGDLP